MRHMTVGTVRATAVKLTGERRKRKAGGGSRGRGRS
jgi:hypothetical protein